jgi:hypothetical protein
MAATTKELKILITIANQAKDGLANLLSDLASMQNQLDALTSTLSDFGKDTDGLSAVGEAAQEATSNLENTNEAAKQEGEKKKEEASKEAEGHGEGGHGGGGGGGGHEPPSAAGLHEEEGAHHGAADAAHEHTNAIEKLSEAFEKLMKWVTFVSGGFLAIEAIHLGKEFLDVAARTETLGVVLGVVGTTAGYTTEQLEEADKAIQKMGITAESSRESLTDLIKAGIDIDLAPRLARASQDLAVVAGQNSSETFRRLIVNIDQMDTLGLKFMGVMINKEAVMAQAAADAGRAITGTAQKQVFANAVLDESIKLSGVYEASMNTVGKMLTSFPRYIEEFKDAVGALGQGFYVEIVKGATEIVKALTELAKAFKEEGPNAEAFGEEVAQAGDHASGLAGAVRSASHALVEMIEFLTEHKEILEQLVKVLRDVALGYAIVWGVNKVVAFRALVLSFLPTLITMFGYLANTLTAVAIRFAAMWVAATGPIGVVVAGVAALGAAIYGVYKLMSDNDKKKTDIVDPSKIKENTKLVDEYAESLKRTKELREKQDSLIDDRRVATVKSVSGTKEEREKYRKEAEDLTTEINEYTNKIKKETEKRQKVVEEINKNGKLDEHNVERVKAANEDFAEFNKAKTDADKFEKDLGDNLAKVRSDVGSYRRGVSQEFGEASGAIDVMVEGLHTKGTVVANAISSISSALDVAASKVTNNNELQKYEELQQRTLESLKKELSEEDFNNLKNAYADRLLIVKNQVSEANAAEAAGGAKALAFHRTQSKQESEFRVTRLQEDISRRKALFDIDLSNERFRLENGLENLRSYFANRSKLIDDGLEDDKRLSVAKIADLQIKKTLTTDPNAQAAIDAQITAERARIQQSEINAQKERQALLVETYNTQVHGEQLIAQLREDINTRYGHEEVAIRSEVARSLRDELVSLGSTASAEDIILAKRKAELDLQTKMTELTLKRQDSELQLKRSFLDLLDAEVNSARDDGLATTLDAQEALNANIRDRLDLLKQEREGILAARDAYLSMGNVTSANEMNLKAMELTKQMYQLRDSIVNVGGQLEKTFADSFASNLQAVIEHTKSFKQAFFDIFRDLNSQILKVLTKDVAENFVKSMKQGAQGGEGGFFQQIAALVTGKPQQEKPDLGASPSGPLWIKNVDPTKDAIPPQLLTTADSMLTQLQLIAQNTATMASRSNNNTSVQGTPGQGNEGTPGGLVPFDTTTANSLLGRGNKPVDSLAMIPAFDEAAKSAGLDKYNLNGDFLRYMALKESGMNPYAKSPSGAEGLMQLMPDTYKDLGYDHGDMMDPAKNVMAGAKYLAQQLEKYSGDLDKALSAYNAGPGNTDKAIAKGLPYAQNKETQDYVAKLGTGSNLFLPTADKPMPVVVVTGSKADVAAAKEDQIQQVVISATREQVEAAKADTDTTKENTTATTESIQATKTSTEQLTNFAQSVAQAQIQLHSIVSPQAGQTSTSVSGVDSNADITQVNGLSPADKAPIDKVDGFANTTAAPISAALGQAIGQKLGGPAGTFAATITQLLGPKLVQPLVKGLGENLSKGFKDVGDNSKEDIDSMSGSIGDTLSSFFSNFGSTIMNFFSGSGGGSGGGFLSSIASLFGGGGEGDAAATVAEALFADGGMVSGPGTGTSDSIPARLSHGEYVMTAEKTAQYLPLLEAMRTGVLDTTLSTMFSGLNIDIPTTPQYATGGYVSEMHVGNTTHSRPVNVNMTVVTPDANSFRRSQDQIASKTGQQVNRAIRRNN